MKNKQLIMIATAIFITITMTLSSSAMFYDFSAMGKPVWGPAGEKNAHQIFSQEHVVGLMMMAVIFMNDARLVLIWVMEHMHTVKSRMDL